MLRERGPFGLVFADAGPYDWDAIVSLLEPGGLVVKDDLTPGRPIEGDPVREALLRNPRLAAVELLTTPETAAIVAVLKAQPKKACATAYHSGGTSFSSAVASASETATISSPRSAAI
ncbi:MAG TPA: hypothetical protein VE261_08335 [Gaiellaceae bacterium]|nr:hypothetical protein [Gaiellaceae bacterium]